MDTKDLVKRIQEAKPGDIVEVTKEEWDHLPQALAEIYKETEEQLPNIVVKPFTQ